MTNIMVLSTKAKAFESAVAKSGELDFWDSMEPAVILKMQEMQLEDLINLMWASMEVKKGTKVFFDELEKELTKRVLRVKDEEFQVLISCFSQDDNPIAQGNFSHRFM